MLSAPLLTPAGKSIVAPIRIGQEIRCLPYAGFLYIIILYAHKFLCLVHNSGVLSQMKYLNVNLEVKQCYLPIRNPLTLSSPPSLLSWSDTKRRVTMTPP